MFVGVNLALSWISLIISFILRKLPGLESMFVLQISWMTLAFLDTPKFISLWQTYPLHYSFGYNHRFF